MDKIDWNAASESTKLLLRLLVFVIIPPVIAYLLESINLLDIPEFYQGLISVALIAVDKYIHEAKNIEARGLVRF